MRYADRPHGASSPFQQQPCYRCINLLLMPYLLALLSVVQDANASSCLCRSLRTRNQDAWPKGRRVNLVRLIQLS